MGRHISRGKTSDAIDQKRLASQEALFSTILIVQTVDRDNSASRMKASPGRSQVEVGKVRTRGHGERLSIKPTREYRPSPHACVAAKVRPIPQGFVP